MSDAVASASPSLAAEARRRAYLQALGLDAWVPRTVLPFAAPSRPEALWVEEAAEAPVAARVIRPEPAAKVAPAAAVAEAPAANRPRIEIPRPAALKPAATLAVEPEPERAPPREPAPRFALQLLQAGRCLLLLELPTGDTLGARDPAYLLLRDLLRAAGLPETPRIISEEPIRWPLLNSGQLDQGPTAAAEFVQSYVSGHQERLGAGLGLWLIGGAAWRCSGGEDGDDTVAERETALGPAWRVPGLETLMEEPARKAALWQAMRPMRRRWTDE
ncbi:MAG: energy transducer TonB [Pseudomonas oryzihabitans]